MGGAWRVGGGGRAVGRSERRGKASGREGRSDKQRDKERSDEQKVVSYVGKRRAYPGKEFL